MRNWRKLDIAVDFVQATTKTVTNKIPSVDTVLGKVGLQRKAKAGTVIPNVDNITDATFKEIPNELMNKIKAAKNKDDVDSIAENHS